MACSPISAFLLPNSAFVPFSPSQQRSLYHQRKFPSGISTRENPRSNLFFYGGVVSAADYLCGCRHGSAAAAMFSRSEAEASVYHRGNGGAAGAFALHLDVARWRCRFFDAVAVD